MHTDVLHYNVKILFSTNTRITVFCLGLKNVPRSKGIIRSTFYLLSLKCIIKIGKRGRVHHEEWNEQESLTTNVTLTLLELYTLIYFERKIYA